MSREVMQQALDALIEYDYAKTDKAIRLGHAAIGAIRTAIAQPVPKRPTPATLLELHTASPGQKYYTDQQMQDYARATLAQPEQPEQPECSTHPAAPHGFNRNGSHNNGRYTCDCEGWTPQPDVAIDSLVAEFEAMPGGVDAMEKGKQWVRDLVQPAMPMKNALIDALERAGAAESALRRLVDECENEGTPNWQNRMVEYIDHANRLLARNATIAQPAAGVAVEMSSIAKYKLDELTKQGYVVNGYAIERRAGILSSRGFITEGGMVCWWRHWHDKPMGVVEVAQPEQEPVGYMIAREEAYWIDMPPPLGSFLYTSPPQRKPLTTEVAMKLLAALLNILECDEDDRIPSDLAEEARAAIEAAHGIKETK